MRRRARCRNCGGKGVMEILQMLPPLLVNAVAHIAPAHQVARLMGAVYPMSIPGSSSQDWTARSVNT